MALHHLYFVFEKIHVINFLLEIHPKYFNYSTQKFSVRNVFTDSSDLISSVVLHPLYSGLFPICCKISSPILKENSFHILSVVKHCREGMQYLT